MNKKVLAVAVAGVLAAPASVAFAQSTVTLSGSIRPSFDFLRAGGTKTTNTSKTSVSDNTSRFMMNGTEDLGGGLKAEFQAQVRLLVDTGVTASAQRQIFAGLAGGWGAIRLGNQDNAFDDMTYDGSFMNPINGSALHTPNNLLGNYGIAGTTTPVSFDNRLPNSVQYYSPVIGGFQGRLQYSANEGKADAGAPAGTSTSDNPAYVLGLDYTAGPLRIGFAHETLKNGTGFGGLSAANINTATGGTGEVKMKGSRFAAMYTLPSKTSIGAIFEQLKVQTTAGDIKRNGWEIGALQEFGNNHQIWANMTRAQKSKGLTQVGAGTDDAANQTTLGYKYLLSKRSQVYAAYTRLDNKTNAAYSISSLYASGAGNQDMSAMSVGMKHDF